MEKVTNNSGSNYCKMPDGTLIQWGYGGGYKGSGRADTDVTMLYSFVGTYCVYATSSWYNDATLYEALCTAIPKAQNVITVHQKNVSENFVYGFYWLAIGRWK